MLEFDTRKKLRQWPSETAKKNTNADVKVAAMKRGIDCEHRRERPTRTRCPPLPTDTKRHCIMLATYEKIP